MTLNVARKADREVMAQKFNEVVLHAGGGICRIDPMLEGPREIAFSIRAGDVCLQVEFDGDDRQQREGTWVLAWHVDHNSDARMTEAFEAAAGAEVNPFHRRKCTAVAWSFEQLCEQVRAVVRLAVEGKATS